MFGRKDKNRSDCVPQQLSNAERRIGQLEGRLLNVEYVLRAIRDALIQYEDGKGPGFRVF